MIDKTLVICDIRILFKLKDKFYKIIDRLVMIYKSECWVVKKITFSNDKYS